MTNTEQISKSLLLQKVDEEKKQVLQQLREEIDKKYALMMEQLHKEVEQMFEKASKEIEQRYKLIFEKIQDENMHTRKEPKIENKGKDTSLITSSTQEIPLVPVVFSVVKKTDYEQKLSWLQSKWSREQTDSAERRLISTIIRFGNCNLVINQAIIADDLESFKANYKELYEENLVKTLKLSSLCGSEKISDFLLTLLKVDYTAPICNFILGYACASNNPKWALKIAEFMSNKKVSLPASVYLYSNSDLLREIKNIFHITYDEP